MIRTWAPLAAAAVMLAAVGAARAADTPQQVYAHKLRCASLWAAGQTEAGSDKKKDAEQDARSARNAAVAAGSRAGVPPARVDADIDSGRDKLLAEAHQPDRTKAKKAESEMGGDLLLCGIEGLKSGDLKHS